MTVQRIARAEVASRAVEMLGLDSETVNLSSIEGLCASLRRAASLLCPASPRQIVDAVLEALTPLVENVHRETVAEALDALVTSGDLLELRQAGTRARLLYLGPPSFVEKHAGEYLLLGIRPRSAPLLDATATDVKVIYDRHTRSVLLEPASGTATLLAAGLHRLSKEQWTMAPRTEPPAQLIERIRGRLSAEHAPGQVSGLNIMGSAGSGQFYKGRWREPTNVDNGIFTGRRPQAYGAPIWCAVELVSGMPQAVLDLPTDSTVAPGWDEARRIQAALDAKKGAPQVYRVRPVNQPYGDSYFDFFAPLPSWAERYLAISGCPAAKGLRSLFTYSLPQALVDDTQRFLAAALWMTTIKEDH